MIGVPLFREDLRVVKVMMEGDMWNPSVNDVDWTKVIPIILVPMNNAHRDELKYIS